MNRVPVIVPGLTQRARVKFCDVTLLTLYVMLLVDTSQADPNVPADRVVKPGTGEELMEKDPMAGEKDDVKLKYTNIFETLP